MKIRTILLSMALFMAFFSCTSTSISKTDYSPAIQTCRESILKIMEEQRIPGLSVAVASSSGVLWAEGFGYTDTDNKIPVNPDTLFSIQSMSKNFTAAAVLKAVDEGLLDLDVPITTYLPDFTVNSRFEKNPQKKMTLRILLSHKAGFTHEAPVGNNFVPGKFDEHIESISRTWLRFPVGQRFSYSNLGVDLAGWILQIRTKMPFHQYVEQKLLDPLKMKMSFFDMEKIKADLNKAIGHDGSGMKLPVDIPMVPSGGFYSSASELARWVQWHLNEGKVDGKALIPADLFKQMTAIPNQLPGQNSGYGLGTGIRMNHGSLRFGHGGGGFGFISAMNWYPEWNLGAVLLTNSSSHNAQSSLINELLDRFIEVKLGRMPADQVAKVDPSLETAAFSPEQLQPLAGKYLYNRGGYMIIQFKDNRLGAGEVNAPTPFTFFTQEGDAYIDYGGMNFYYKFVRNQDGRPDYLIRMYDGEYLDWNDGPYEAAGPDKAEWNQYLGEYRCISYGRPAGKFTIQKKNGHLWIDYMKLEEYREGLFFTSHGECLDFRGPEPTWRNIKLEKRTE